MKTMKTRITGRLITALICWHGTGETALAEIAYDANLEDMVAVRISDTLAAEDEWECLSEFNRYNDLDPELRYQDDLGIEITNSDLDGPIGGFDIIVQERRI